MRDLERGVGMGAGELQCFSKLIWKLHTTISVIFFWLHRPALTQYFNTETNLINNTYERGIYGNMVTSKWGASSAFWKCDNHIPSVISEVLTTEAHTCLTQFPSPCDRRGVEISSRHFSSKHTKIYMKNVSIFLENYGGFE